jgi:hypothetical protein
VTKLEQLRAELDAWRLGEVKVAAVLNRSLRAAAPQLLDLWQACEAERAAVCTNQPTRSAVADGSTALLIRDVAGRCVGSKHTEACPVATARGAVTSVLERGLP